MINVRVGVFETNSSSVHAMIICTEEEYDQVMKDHLLIVPYAEELISWEDAKKDLVRHNKLSTAEVEAMSGDELRERLKYYDVAVTLDDWDSDYIPFTYKYTSPSGDEIVAFGHTGCGG